MCQVQGFKLSRLKTFFALCSKWSNILYQQILPFRFIWAVNFVPFEYLSPHSFVGEAVVFVSNTHKSQLYL